MPSKQLILHVGFHKAGTSALQESFYAQRENLLAEGVLYPDIGRKAHHQMAWAITQKPWGWKGRGGETTPYKTFRKIARKINRAKQDKVVLSSEFFSELTADQILKIASEIKGREIKVLFTLRPLVKLLSSSYQQYLKYGTKVDYESWLHSVLDNPGVSKVNPTFWKRHFHGEVVARWAEIFGPDAVTVLIVDEKKPEFLYQEMNKYLSLPQGFLKQQETGTNRSLSLEEVSLLLELNKRFPQKRSWPEYLAFVRNGYIRQLTDHVPVAPGAQKLPTPKWAITKANKIAKGSKEKIMDAKVTVIGDIASLDSSSVVEGTPIYSEKIDIETVSQAMLCFDKRLVKRLPVMWLIKAVRKKLLKPLRLRGNQEI
jgi:hypothetical protein